MDLCEEISHEVGNTYTSVVNVGAEVTSGNWVGINQSGSTLSEWVEYHAITSLESDLGLEGVRTNSTNHLERNVWAIEQTSIIRGSTLITSDEELSSVLTFGR